MWRTLIVMVATLCLISVAQAQQAKPQPAEGAARPRIGIYDARAVAVAWAPSKMHSDEMKGKLAELKEAEKTGDTARAAELKAWGKMRQERLHLQGFAGAGVDDILEKLPAGGMEQVAKEAGVDAIVRKGEYVSDLTETVDVTDAVVKLFGEPSERTKKTIEELRKKAPVDRKVIEGTGRKSGS